MPYEVTYKAEGDVLVVEIFGDRPSDPAELQRASHATWRQVASTAKDGEYVRLLIISHARGDYPTLKAYEINSTLAECGVEKGWKIAFVNLDQGSFENVKFAETVAVNRGFKVGVFKDESSARDWLKE